MLRFSHERVPNQFIRDETKYGNEDEKRQHEWCGAQYFQSFILFFPII